MTVQIVHGHRVRTIPIVDLRVGMRIVHSDTGQILTVAHKSMVNLAVTLRDDNGDHHTVHVELYHDAHVLIGETDD